jgi:CheY-like chemotaxis protein/HPt (histidine-containing phosphotransfer) domain-containing protein
MSAALKPFDVALLDHQMPGGDGAELGRRINADSRLNATRLVLLTSSGQHSDRDEFAALGFAGYLLKPVSRNDLIETLSAVLASSADDWHARTQPIVTRRSLRERRGHEARRILVAEDDAVNRKVAVKLLELLGYQADTANDGAEAVDAWRKGRYDLILMDCQMPALDGYEATRQIRMLESPPRRIPIIALTANVMPGVEAECKAAGMDAYITKPFDRDHLEARLEEFLAMSASNAGPATGPELPERPTSCPVDMEALTQLAAGDEEFKRDLIQTFITVGGGQVEEIEAALARDDVAAVSGAAHKLKANSGYLFAAAVSDAAAKVEAAARAMTDGREPEGGSLAELVEELGQEFRRAVDYLSAAAAA